mmetsp:Transcript_40136/g.96948  ORF Transcript_40136/g.96948 Transcript_40136/m.96948 type:complete len:80 (+) Transcript_40136:22-261(+)
MKRPSKQITIVVGTHNERMMMFGMKKSTVSFPTTNWINGINNNPTAPAEAVIIPPARPTTGPAIKLGKKLKETPNKNDL